ncbi:MAG: MoxR family ATPase [Alphaproteobacteria bacterium]|nr:MoxR family ATPase [Alphaproteobacteria bacterium]
MSAPPNLSGQTLLGRPGADGTRPVYYADEALLHAARIAIALRRPLLLTGAPGCGKTDFAWALASALHPDEPPLECRVRSTSRARDLLYHYDAVQRFTDATHAPERARDPRNYVELMELGVGLREGRRRVVLIDEIDKAPRDLPNDLLRVVEDGNFRIPELSMAPEAPREGDALALSHEMTPLGPERPVLIITSNVERQLPAPFLRRCVYFDIDFPSKARLLEILRSRGDDGAQLLQALPGGAEALPELAVDLFLALREEPNLSRYPSTSELIDWVQALRLSLQPDRVAAALTELWRARDSARGTLRASPELGWAQLPAISCLIKLREDLVRLKVKQEARAWGT